MSNLAYTDAKWLRFFRELGLWLRVGRTIEERRRRYTRERIQIRNLNDFNGNITAISFTDMSKYGTSTDEEGRLYVRFVANGGNWDMHIYAATGAASEVAQVINAADGATTALTAVNSSGIVGSVTFSGAVVAEADDVHQLLVLQDWKRESLLIFPSDGTTENDTASRNAFEDFLADARSSEAALLARWRAGLSQWALTAPDNAVARGGEFLKEAQASLVTEAPDRDSAGAVSRLLTGFFPTLSQDMADELTGSVQDIIERNVAMSAVSFASNNTGSATMATPTPSDRCPLGTWLFKCTRGLGNGYGGREEFELSYTGTDVNDDETFTDTVRLRIGQSFTFPRGGGSSTLTRSFTKTGDAGNADFGAASTFSFSGETENNTSSGQVFAVVAANGSNWDMKFYKDSGANTGDLVAQATNVATAAAGVQATPRNGSGLTITFTVGSGPTATNTATIDANYFSVQNSVSVPDEFRFTTTLTDEGKASRVLAFLLQAEINGDTSGSELISDNLLAGANTDLNFIVADF